MIIEELNNEGINLQETRLNLISQGYEKYWDNWIWLVWWVAIVTVQSELARESLREHGLI